MKNFKKIIIVYLKILISSHQFPFTSNFCETFKKESLKLINIQNKLKKKNKRVYIQNFIEKKILYSLKNILVIDFYNIKKYKKYG